MAKRTIKIRLGEKGNHLEISTLITVLQDTVGILRGIDKAITGERSPALHWSIRRIEMKSPLEAILEAEVVNDGVVAPEVVRPFMRGLKAMEKTSAPPRYFGDHELTRTKRIVDLQHNGVQFVEFTSDRDKPIRPTTRVSEHIQSLLGPAPTRPYEQFAEIEGTLEDVSLHPDIPQFAIYDPLTYQPVECSFDSQDIDTITNLMKRKARVFVTGVAKFNARHHPVSICVEKIEELPDQKDLPQIGQLRKAGLNLTNGRDPVDVIRGLRNGR